MNKFFHSLSLQSLLLGRGEDEFIVAVFIGLGIFFLLMTYMAYASYYSSLNQAFNTVARHFGGKQKEGGIFFGAPKVQFVHWDTRVNIGYHTQDRATWTVVTIDWDQGTFWCEVSPHTFFSQLGGLISRSQYRTQVKAFDRQFVIKANDHELAEKIFNPEVLDQLLRYYQKLECRHFVMKWEKGKLTFSCPQRLIASSILILFTEQSLEVYNRMSGWAEREHEIVFDDLTDSISAPASDEPITCQVCGEAFTAETNPHEIVYCKTCDTPHHLECWKFNRSCSIYACGQTSFVRKSNRVVTGISVIDRFL